MKIITVEIENPYDYFAKVKTSKNTYELSLNCDLSMFLKTKMYEIEKKCFIDLFTTKTIWINANIQQIETKLYFLERPELLQSYI